MKNYKSKDNQVYSYENDVSLDFLNKKIEELGLIEISQTEVNKIAKSKVYISTPKELLINEKSILEARFNLISRHVTVCYANGLIMSQEYPEEFKELNIINKRIDEIEKELAK